jgi:cytidine deaminase
MELNPTKRVEAAREAAERAYAPYSKFKVGAAIELNNGDIITGCNVENVSYGLSNCAERTAIYRAIAEGIDLSNVKAITIYTPTEQLHSPCGACRQVMAEFFSADTQVSSANRHDIKHWTVGSLLPESFSF